MAFRVNEVLTEYFRTLGVRLVDFKLEFGRLADGTLVLADEISPDTCRFWDLKTNEKLDKDRFPPRHGRCGGCLPRDDAPRVRRIRRGGTA